MSALFNNLPILIFVLSTAIASILYIREYNLRKKLSADEKILDQARQKGWDVIHESIKKSQAILGQAELEGIKVAAETKFESQKLEQQYEAKLQNLIDQSRSSLDQSQRQFAQFLQELQNKSIELEGYSQKAVQDRVNQLFAGMEQRLADFLMATEQRTTSSIELELKSARNLIDTYKSEQLKLIDENIVAMMEQTLAVVLTKKLSLKDQLELVYEALEKAKVEKFIV